MKKMIRIIQKNRIVFFCMIIFFALSLFAEVNALELKYNYTKEYLDWLNLSDEEKAQSIMPQMTGVKKNVKSQEAWGDKDDFISEMNPVGGIELESRFNLAEKVNIRIKDQGITNECWAFSAYTSLESSLLYKAGLDINFSERHMDYATSGSFYNKENLELDYIREVKNGALPETGLAYLTNGQGAVLESEMPFEDNYDEISINDINIKPSYYVTEYKQFPSIYKKYNEDGSIKYFDSFDNEYSEDDVLDIRKEIKEYLKTTGPITSVMAGEYLQGYNNLKCPHLSTAFCCKDENEQRDHSITIVGWDDNYSKENFSINNRPNSDGAYIVLQSYGEKFFDNGYMYISYEDCLIETILYGISGAKEYDYDNLYQHNYYGTTGTLYLSGYDTGYQATIFERDASKSEVLNKISFNLPEKATVQLYVNPNGDDLANLVCVSEWLKDLDAGYHTIDIEELQLTSDKFVIMMVQKSESGNFNFNVEYRADKIFYANVTSKSGRNKISVDGERWDNLEDLSNDELINTVDLCLKAFTIEKEIKPNDKEIEISSDKYVIDSNYIKNVDALTQIDSFMENLNINANEIILRDEKIDSAEEMIYLKTGMKLILDNNEYTVIVKGDINGDGKISLIDLSKLIAHYAEIKNSQLLDLEQLAGDINFDGKISLIDLSKLLMIYSEM